MKVRILSAEEVATYPGTRRSPATTPSTPAVDGRQLQAEHVMERANRNRERLLQILDALTRSRRERVARRETARREVEGARPERAAS